MISILFVSTNTIQGHLVSAMTLSKINHVAVRIDEFVYEMDSKGMSKLDYSDYALSNLCIEIPVRGAIEQDGFDFHNTNMDRKYDTLKSVVYPFAFMERAQNDDRWHCVEHAIFFLEEVKDLNIDPFDINSPAKLFNVARGLLC